MIHRPVLAYKETNVIGDSDTGIFSKSDKTSFKKGLQVRSLKSDDISSKTFKQALEVKKSSHLISKKTTNDLPFKIFSDNPDKVCQHCSSTVKNRRPVSNSGLNHFDSKGVQTISYSVQEEGIQVSKDDISVRELHDELCSDTAPESYWENIAEQRRQALEITLEENELLYSRNAELQDELDRLRLIADQAEHFAQLFQRAKDNSIETEEDSESNE